MAYLSDEYDFNYSFVIYVYKFNKYLYYIICSIFFIDKENLFCYLKLVKLYQNRFIKLLHFNH